jgi:phenylacetate-coenzyme A ligase PaaK-like adenylate-forming protein
MSPSWKFSPAYYERSLNTLNTALGGCSAYKSWREFDPGPGFPIDARYAALPWLTKTDIREHFPDGFVPPERNLKQALANEEVWFVTTSGTMDLAVTNIWNPEWWFASERASWKLNSHLDKICTAEHTEAILANPINVGFKSDEGDLPPENRRWGNYLYLNEKTTPLLWTPQLMNRMVKELGEFKPDIMEANPSLLAKLCRYVAAKGQAVYQPKAIVLTYEYPTVFHYRQFRQVFNCPTVSSYGSTELGYVFEECEYGKLHQNTEFCRVDLQPLAPEQGEPDVYRLLTTTFNNPWYYLVRFDVSDLVRIDTTGKCPCGREEGIILSDIEGRAMNSTVSTTGKLVTPFSLDKAISVLENVDEYRLDQETPDGYLLRLVSERPDKDALTKEATSILKKLYGRDANITVIYEKAITPEASGKYRLSRANFPIEIENFLDPRFLVKTT